MIRRGLTLIEVLAATVILSSSAAVCAGLLRSARQALESPRVSIQELAVLADAFMDDPEPFGIKKSELAKVSSLSISWSDFAEPDESPLKHETMHESVLVTRIDTSESPGELLPHGWLVFANDGKTVIRYLALPEVER